MKKIIVILCCVLILLLIGSVCTLFLTGVPVQTDNLYIEVEDSGNQINIHVTTSESAAAFTSTRMHCEGTTLYITMNKVLPSPVYRTGEKSIYLEKTDFTDIFFCGKHIWSDP